jgi:hypothetical protein
MCQVAMIVLFPLTIIFAVSITISEMFNGDETG